MTGQQNMAQELLQQGITAIKAKDKSLARDLLTQASNIDPTNPTILFWLTAALEDPYEQEFSLKKVLELEPSNTMASKGLEVTQKRIVDSAYKRGVDAAQSGNLDLARSLLTEVVERDEGNIPAWEWLSQVVETSDDQEVCLNNILTLDPDNQQARGKLDLLSQMREITEQNPWSEEYTGEDQEQPFVAPTLAGDILGEAYKEKYTTVIPDPEPELESVSITLWKKYEDTMGCPYCANPTEHKQKRCPKCNNRLWISSRYSESRSTLLWILILMQLMSAVMLTLIPLISLFSVAQRLGIFNFFNLIPAYLGFSSPINANIIAAAFEILPRYVFFLTWVPALVSLLYAIALYVRWTPVYYLLLISAVLGLASAIAGLAGIVTFNGSLIAGVVGIVISLVTLVMVIKLESDFRKTRHRLYLDLDPGLEEGMSYLLHGKQYARKGMWALAAIHLRRAIALMPYNADAFLATAVACSHLKDYDLARTVLQNALEFDPDNPRIQQALDVLGESKASSETFPDSPTQTDGTTVSTDNDPSAEGEQPQEIAEENDEEPFIPEVEIDTEKNILGTTPLYDKQDLFATESEVFLDQPIEQDADIENVEIDISSDSHESPDSTQELDNNDIGS